MTVPASFEALSASERYELQVWVHVHGAILGALIMQSLQSGMAMVGVDAPLQNIVVGAVLVLAVWIDIVYRRRTGGKS